jgi:biotin transport system substrate-specific component
MLTPQYQIQPLASKLWVETPGNTHLRSITLVLFGTALLALSAHVQVPFWPVKMSMQSFVVLALGITYGSRLGALTIIVYLLEGAVGLPVFQAGGSLAHFAGPTAGYLLGFVVAAWVVGRAAEYRLMRNLPSAIAILLLGDAIIMALGTGWLSTLIGFEKALSAGFLVFLPAEALKISLAVALARATDRTIRAQ